jgi:DNA invertase Pin-like site-specific DNA recombinase
MTHVAYLRVSTTDQSTARQLSDTAIAFTKTFEDKASGGSTDRPALSAMLEYIREGDTVHVHSIDRLARNLGDLLELIKSLNAKGINVHFHKENLVFTGEASPMNELMLNLLGSVYQFERAMIKDRQLEGIAKAKVAGKYKGKARKVTDEAILQALASGLSIRKTATELGCGISTVQRVKASEATGATEQA